jgi:hypothetical protein
MARAQLFYPNRIKSSKDEYGYHFELGKKDTDILEQLLLNEQIRIDVTRVNCNSTQSQTASRPRDVVVVEVAPRDPNAGCAELHDLISRHGKSIYPKFHEEDKRLQWVNTQTKKLYDLPGGCLDREQELKKFFSIAKSLWPKFHEEDQRYAWYNKMLNSSFSQVCRYESDDLGRKI